MSCNGTLMDDVSMARGTIVTAVKALLPHDGGTLVRRTVRGADGKQCDFMDYEPNPGFGPHFCPTRVHSQRVLAVGLIVPSILSVLLLLLDLAVLGTQYFAVGNQAICVVTYPITRSCLGQDLGECCRGERHDAIGLGCALLLLLLVGLGTVGRQLKARSFLHLVTSPWMPVCHMLGLSDAVHGIQLCLRTVRSAPAAAQPVAPATPSTPAQDSDLTVRGHRARSMSAFQQANPLTPGATGAVTAARAALVPGQPAACLLEASAPYHITGVSTPSLQRAMLVHAPMAILHMLALASWYLMDPNYTSGLVMGTCSLHFVLLIWLLVAGDVAGIAMHSPRFYTSRGIQRYHSVTGALQRLPALLANAVKSTTGPQWPLAVVATLLSTAFRTSDVVSRALLVALTIAASGGAMLIPIVLVLACFWWPMMCDSYPRLQHMELRNTLKAWAAPRKSQYQPADAPYIAGAQSSSRALGPSITPRKESMHLCDPAKRRSPPRPSISHKGSVTSASGADGNGAPVEPFEVDSEIGRLPVPDAWEDEHGEMHPVEEYEGFYTEDGLWVDVNVAEYAAWKARGGVAASNANSPESTAPAAAAAAESDLPAQPNSAKRCCCQCLNRSGNACRPRAAKLLLWCAESARVPCAEPRFMQALVSTPTPYWSPLWSQVQSLPDPLSTLPKLGRMLLLRAVEDVTLLLILTVCWYNTTLWPALATGVQFVDMLPASQLLDVDQQNSLFWAAAVCTCVKYAFLLLYLPIMQFWAQPALRPDGSQPGSGGGGSRKSTFMLMMR